MFGSNAEAGVVACVMIMVVRKMTIGIRVVKLGVRIKTIMI